MSKHWTDSLKHNKVQFIEDFKKENPEVTYRREFAKQVSKNPIDMKNYDNVGGVEHHKTTDSVIDKMITKNEAARGKQLSKEVPKKGSINFSGINDDRKVKGQKFKMGFEG